METVLFREHKASFGAYLRALRVGRGLSLRDAASKLDVSFAKLQKMETGGRFRIESPAIFDAMAALFERPVAEVLAAAGVRFDVPALTAPGTGREIWLYRRGGGWSRIPDFTWKEDATSHDLDDEMAAAGYDPCTLTYGREYGLMVEVHRGRHGTTRPPYDYFVWVNVGGTCEPVAVPTLPDLIALLGELKPLADPQYIGIAPATGWTAGGKAVGAFVLSPDGGVTPMVAATRSEDSGLVEEFGGLRGP
jgi:transcriptional regulator with XRE-family HTH domain